MSILEQLGVQTIGLIETMTPFEMWKGSSVQRWEVTLQMLTMGDLVEVAKLTGNASPLEMSYLTKVYLLSKCMKSINGREIVTTEDLAEYNKTHNLTGNAIISLFDYKIIFIKKLSESVVNRLAFLYDEMSNKYVASLLGKSIIPDELDATRFDSVPSAEELEQEHTEEKKLVSNESDNSSTTT